MTEEYEQYQQRLEDVRREVLLRVTDYIRSESLDPQVADARIQSKIAEEIKFEYQNSGYPLADIHWDLATPGTFMVKEHPYDQSILIHLTLNLDDTEN